jgi:hypothetical protein
MVIFFLFIEQSPSYFSFTPICILPTREEEKKSFINQDSEEGVTPCTIDYQ